MAAPEPQPGARGGEPIDPGVDIGHVHLRVADLDRALDFYVGVLGFELQQRFGPEAARSSRAERGPSTALIHMCRPFTLMRNC